MESGRYASGGGLRSGWGARWWRWIALAWLGLAGAAAWAGAAAAPLPANVLIAEAEFALAEAGPWRRVALPDTWADRGVARPTTGWYRLRLLLPTDAVAPAPGAMWAVSAEQIGTRHRIWLNGALLHDTLALAGAGSDQTQGLLLQLPPGLLRAGENQLVMQVEGGPHAGLSPLALGPALAVDQAFGAQQWLRVALPQQLNVAAVGGCLFALLLWWRRRSEAAMGWFGLLGLLVSLRNQAYFLANPGLSPTLSSGLFFAVQVGTVVLLGLFAMSLTRRRPRGYRATLLGAAALMLVASMVAGVAGEVGAIDRLRAIAYPVLGALALPALALIALRVRAMRGGELAALLAALVVVLLAGAHDHLIQQGQFGVTATWWLPYATPLMVLAFAVLMVGRVVLALSQVEVLNLTLEQRVRERTQALATAHAAKSRFLAAASHDLRQPVVTIGLLVGLLREQVAAPALRAMVARVDEAVAAMESLLAGLLDLSRLESGHVRVRAQRLPLQPLFDAVAVHEAEAARRKGLMLRVRPSALAVQADPVLLEQIVRNLVSNAVRYTDVGGVLLAARISAGGRVRVQVWDTGRGIPPEQQAAVFEEFVQLDNPHRERSLGLGLGLAIVQRSAALLGATLALRSTPGRGSCFSLDLPRADGGGSVAAEQMPAERWLAGRRVVLVEDEAAVRDALAARLAAWGAQVQAHGGPRELRAALDALPPEQRQADLLITDWRLPGGNGGDVAALARRRLGQLPVLVISGNTAPADIAEFAASGLAVLHKPFRAEELRAAISAALAR